MIATSVEQKDLNQENPPNISTFEEAVVPNSYHPPVTPHEHDQTTRVEKLHEYNSAKLNTN